MPFLSKQVLVLLCCSALRALIITALIALNTSIPLNASPMRPQSNQLDPDQLTNTLLPPLDTIVTQASQDFHGVDLGGKDGLLEKIGFDLAQLHAEYQAYLNAAGSPAAFESDLSMVALTHSASESYVVIDAVADQGITALADSLELLGIQNSATFGAVVSGELPILALPDLAALTTLRFARPALVETDGGVAISQADRAMGADNARSAFISDGAGVKVGVLSDSYNCLGGAANDVASGDVPPNVEVLAEEARCATGKDEGRAMVQLIADIVPGADQAFHTAFGGQAAFANGILKLANDAQADVIVDDVRYLAEPMFQDGIIAQAVDQVVAQGIPYFASAGNNARQAYESPFVDALGILPIELPVGLLHDFNPGSAVDPLQQIKIPVGATATFNLQWDQPYASATGGSGAASDLDMLLLGLGSTSPLAVAIDKNIGRDPIEILRYKNPGPGTTFNLAIVNVAGPKPTRMKYIYSGSTITIEEYGTQSGTIYGHANSQGARAVGSAFYLFTPAFDTTPPILELSSSAGPTPILYDPNDAPINQVRNKPEIVAPDGTNTTFFGTDIADPGDGSDSDTFPNFFGTSAAAPHAAAVAALLLAVKPTLPPGDLYAALESSAIDMDAAGFDYNSGYGLIQAIPALEAVTRHDVVNTQKSRPIAALPGQPVDYVIAIHNQGPNPTINVALANTAPTQLQELATVTEWNVSSNLSGDQPMTNAIWQLNNLAAGEHSVITVTGRVNPKLNVDATLVNQSVLTSVSDSQPTNNRSQASVTVRVPRVQFASAVAEGEAEGNKIFRIATDQVNPYADIQVRYTTSSTKAGTGYVPISGIVTIPRGESSVTLTMPSLDGKAAVGESILVQLDQPSGSQLGSLVTIVLATNPDSDNDGAPDDEEEEPQDPCLPDPQADPCDQEPDGLTNAEEKLHGTDPTKPDSDGDGINDGDEVGNESNPLDSCDPNPTIGGCPGGGGDEDRDGDGVNNGSDLEPDDPCVPNPDHPLCEPPPTPNTPDTTLYLPGVWSQK